MNKGRAGLVRLPTCMAAFCDEAAGRTRHRNFIQHTSLLRKGTVLLNSLCANTSVPISPNNRSILKTMDPFAAIGLASNIISFVDYGTKIVNGAREIYDSASGMTEESQALDSIASKMKGLSSKLLPSTGSPRSEDEEALCRIAAECNIISDKILEHLSKIKPKDSRSRRDVFFAAAKNKFREKERLELEKRLASCRSQLDLQLNVLTR